MGCGTVRVDREEDNTGMKTKLNNQLRNKEETHLGQFQIHFPTVQNLGVDAYID